MGELYGQRGSQGIRESVPVETGDVTKKSNRGDAFQQKDSHG